MNNAANYNQIEALRRQFEEAFMQDQNNHVARAIEEIQAQAKGLGVTFWYNCDTDEVQVLVNALAKAEKEN